MTLAVQSNKAAKRLAWILEMEVAVRLDLGLTIDGSPVSWAAINGHVYITDAGNDRIKDIRSSDLEFLQQFGTSGTGDNQFDYPWGICTDGVYLYITDSDNNRIKKHRADDFSFVAKIGSLGTGNDQFNDPREICTDGTYIFVVDRNNHRVVKRRCSDLSYVAQYTGTANGDDHDLNVPAAVCYDGTLLWIGENGGAPINRFVKVNPDTLAYVDHFHYGIGSGDTEFNNPESMGADANYLYIYDQGNARIKKHRTTDFSFVAKYGSWTGDCSDPDCFSTGTGISYRQGNLYVVDCGGSCTQIKKHLASDLSFVTRNGHYGAPTDGNDYDAARGAVAMEVVTYTLQVGTGRGDPSRIRVIDRTTGEVTELSHESSEDAVEWTPGSWYFDEATGTLYIHLPDGTDPAAAGYYIAAYFWRKFCDGQYPDPEAIEDAEGRWIDPRLKKDSIPDLTMEISGYQEGGVRQTWGSMKLANANGALDEAIVDEIWENKIYVLKVGSPGDAYADFTAISRGRTGSISWDDGEITIGVEDPLKAED